jgi:L-lactate dehydrogenase complex protein LldG
MSRERTLASIRSALGRTADSAVPPPPAIRLRHGSSTPAARAVQFKTALEALGGKVAMVPTPADARTCVESILSGRRAAASGAAILKSAGILTLARVRADISREACIAADVGISSADFALADTGSLVILSESRESRLISLLPPCHVAVIDRAAILENLDELFVKLPHPTAQSSSMVLITGPSRTADIEMRLVRGVHGPGEIHVIIVEDVTSIGSGASEEI